MQSKFDPSEHRPYIGAGPNSVQGQAFLTQRDGKIVTCAGKDVLLVPATTFFREVITNFNNRFRRTETAEKIDPVFKPMIKRSQCDVQGNFLFQKIPNGKWFVLASATPPNDLLDRTMVREIALPEQTTQVLLTQKDLPPYVSMMEDYESILNSYFQ
jgi:hypothetical protein